MVASDTAIRDLYALLNALYVRECELHLRLSQEISTALAHYGPCILALDVADPLDAKIIALHYQLARRRIEQFKQEISERTYCLNCSLAVQEMLRLQGVSTEFQCDTSVTLNSHSSCSTEELVQQINTVFLHLMVCNESLQHQLKEIVSASDAWINDKTAKSNQRVSHNTQGSRKVIWCA
ncbi:hypothetical protein [Comamonas sp. E6]|uniref:hypothetical protein n=1 Tax=Comamonas sp. E6 TaxID=364029 RepID=UPI00128B2625|nr:hypothetical protein [Comamonas sp. E6]